METNRDKRYQSLRTDQVLENVTYDRVTELIEITEYET